MLLLIFWKRKVQKNSKTRKFWKGREDWNYHIFLFDIL